VGTPFGVGGFVAACTGQTDNSSHKAGRIQQPGVMAARREWVSQKNTAFSITSANENKNALIFPVTVVRCPSSGFPRQ
jgi:hypothetical protein